MEPVGSRSIWGHESAWKHLIAASRFADISALQSLRRSVMRSKAAVGSVLNWALNGVHPKIYQMGGGPWQWAWGQQTKPVSCFKWSCIVVVSILFLILSKDGWRSGTWSSLEPWKSAKKGSLLHDLHDSHPLFPDLHDSHPLLHYLLDFWTSKRLAPDLVA